MANPSLCAVRRARPTYGYGVQHPSTSGKSLGTRVMAAYGIAARYFDQPHPTAQRRWPTASGTPRRQRAAVRAGWTDSALSPLIRVTAQVSQHVEDNTKAAALTKAVPSRRRERRRGRAHGLGEGTQALLSEPPVHTSGRSARPSLLGVSVPVLPPVRRSGTRRRKRRPARVGPRRRRLDCRPRRNARAVREDRRRRTRDTK
ncbi:hypothetical protein C9J85_11690 [Haloferax sp. wsp5]|nr:hypothetical protein C9J85_11690 [Haloferax sp. wsp5]